MATVPEEAGRPVDVVGAEDADAAVGEEGAAEDVDDAGGESMRM